MIEKFLARFRWRFVGSVLAETAIPETQMKYHCYLHLLERGDGKRKIKMVGNKSALLSRYGIWVRSMADAWVDGGPYPDLRCQAPVQTPPRGKPDLKIVK